MQAGRDGWERGNATQIWTEDIVIIGYCMQPYFVNETHIKTRLVFTWREKLNYGTFRLGMWEVITITSECRQDPPLSWHWQIGSRVRSVTLRKLVIVSDSNVKLCGWDVPPRADDVSFHFGHLEEIMIIMFSMCSLYTSLFTLQWSITSAMKYHWSAICTVTGDL